MTRLQIVGFWVAMIALILFSAGVGIWWNAPLWCAHFGRFC